MSNLSAISSLSGTLSEPETLTGGLSEPSSLMGELSLGGGDFVLMPATTGRLGGVIIGDDILVTPEGRISVDKATSVSRDNTKPVTAAAVYTEIGNINALLATI